MGIFLGKNKKIIGRNKTAVSLHLQTELYREIIQLVEMGLYRSTVQFVEDAVRTYLEKFKKELKLGRMAEKTPEAKP
jgi:Arc/MetJ-type ribon-helix-helix transcriptional regulator